MKYYLNLTNCVIYQLCPKTGQTRMLYPHDATWASCLVNKEAITVTLKHQMRLLHPKAVAFFIKDGGYDFGHMCSV